MWLLVICLVVVLAFLGFEIFTVVRDIKIRKKEKLEKGEKPIDSGVDFEK